MQVWLLTVVVFVVTTFKCARAETLVVTYKEPAPPTVISTVFTTYQTVQTEPIVSTRIVTEVEGSPPTKTINSLGTDTKLPSGDDETSRSSESSGGGGGGGGKGELTQLEIAGIVIGIVLGIITTLATVWMCLRGRRTGNIV